MKKIIYLMSLLLMTIVNQAQVDPATLGNLTPGGYLDTVYDQTGASQALKYLSVNSTNAVITTSCSAGYFNIYYAFNSGLDQIANPTHIAKRNILCKLFTDYSNFINSPLSAPTNTTRVNILIADPTSALAVNPTFLGGGASFYVAASSPSSSNPGIVDTEVYKTIISGTDSYSNVAAPLTFLNGNQFYHAQMVFNPNVNWNLNVNSATMASQTDNDFWSVALHEICHILGFGSNINYGGVSIFGANNNYFSHYDKFLRTANNIPLLATSTSSCFNMNANFNVSPSVVAPSSCSTSPSNVTNCNTAVHYSGGTYSNVAVFTPSCYMSGSSLSHFEDICSTPVGFTSICTSTPANNDLYFAMSNAGGTGDCYIKRYLKPEERSVLCDLGYSVNSEFNASSGTTYGGTVTAGAYFNYSTSCSGNVPLGINDGLTAGNYIYSSATNTLTFPLSTIIANDYNTASITCLQTVYNNGTVSVSGNIITFVAATGVGGPILLRYLPATSAGVTGNITYIHGFIVPPGCNPPNACNLVQNGNFESLPGPICGPISATASPNCWSNTTLLGSPDICVRACASGTTIIGGMAASFSPAINTHNSSNNNFVGLTCPSPTAAANTLETLKNYLSSPLQPNGVYVLNCWIYNSSRPPIFGPNIYSSPVVFSFASDVSYGSNYNGPAMPGTLNSIASFTTMPVNTWVPYTKTFTFTGSQNHNVLYMGIDANASLLLGFNFGSPALNPYLFIDDISILPIAQSPTITVPSTVACTASTFTDLAQYALPLGGVFSGPGVTYSGGKYSFNAALTLTPGTYGITYSYTNNLGCNQSSSFPISILPYTGSVSFALSSPVCQANNTIPNLATFITPTIVNSGVFSGAGVSVAGSNPPIYTLNGNATTLGVHSYTYSYAGCAINLTSTTNILAAFYVNITNSTAQTCLMPGQSTTLTASSNSSSATYTWNSPPITGTNVVVSPTSTTVYSLTGQAGLCTNTQTTLVVVVPMTFSYLPTSACTIDSRSLGNQSFSLLNALAPGTPTAGLWYSIPPNANPGIFCSNNPTGGGVFAYPQPGAAAGTHTIVYIYTAPSGCTVSIQHTITVIVTPTITTDGPHFQCANIPGYASTLQVTSTSTLPMTYTWMPGNLSGSTVTVNPTVSTPYTVIGSDGTCLSMATLADVAVSTVCCGGASAGLPFQYLNTSLGSATLSGLYAINQNLLITGTVSLDGEYYMAPNVVITVAGGGFLNSNATFTSTSNPDPRHSHAHLLSCGAMWNGIVVNSTGAPYSHGMVQFKDLDMIEDAQVAIHSISSTNLYNVPNLYEIQLDHVVFNRNRIAVAIRSYTQSPAYDPPFYITGCVFTSRSLPSTPLTVSTIPYWQNVLGLTSITTPTDPMASPYLFANFPAANLKAPYTNEAANAGVYVENSGLTSNPTTTNTSYRSIIIGDGFNPNPTVNFFDNLNAGISALNSNIVSYSNLFQYTRTLTVGSNILMGDGIRSINDNSNFLNYNSYVNMVSAVNPATNFNSFYDCHEAVRLINVFQLNMQYAQIRSTQTKVNPPPSFAMPHGLFGMFITGNRFKDYTINNCKFLNLDLGIYLSTNVGTNYLSSPISTGQVWGSIGVRNNLFSSAASAGANPANGYMQTAIYFENLLSFKGSAAVGAGIYTISPNNGVWIQNNNFDQVYRGVNMNNFSNTAFGKYTANNLFTITQDHITTRPMFGVGYSNINFGVVNSNTITGFTTALTTTLTGISYGMNNANNIVQCNYVNKLPKGFEFTGTNSVVNWKGNTMQNNSRGIQLSSNGIIGAQGSSTAPDDNLWAGTWTGAIYNTYCLNSQPTLSKITKRTSAGYDPLNNFGIPIFMYNSTSLLNGNSGTWPACVTSSPTKGTSNPGKSVLSSFIAHSTTGDYPGSHSSEAYEINRFLLYEDLREDDELLNSDPDLQDFYTADLQLNIATLSNINQSLAEGDLATSTTLLGGFSPATTIESNYKLFYQLYLKYNDTTEVYTDADKNDLATLAHKCPSIDGAIVYNARALNSVVTGYPEIYNDRACGTDGDDGDLSGDDGSEGGRKANFANGQINSTPMNNGDNNYHLFPNPATDKLYILSNVEQEELNLEIRDVNSKLLSKTTIQVANNKTELKLNLLNGVYFVTLINQNKEHIVKKLVISK